MSSRVILCCFTYLIFLLGIEAQSTSFLTLVPGLPGGVDGIIQASVAGTGTDGTTYVIHGTIEPTSTEIPYTATVVADATHVSESLAVTTGTLTVNFVEECNINSQGNGTCTAVLGTSTTVMSGSITLDEVIFTTSAAERFRNIGLSSTLWVALFVSMLVMNA